MNISEQKIEMEEKCAEQIVGTENAKLEKEQIEEMSSSSMDNKNASEEDGSPPKKKAKKRLKFGGWLPDCLDWFKRPELAQTSLPTSSYTFNQYCWPHLHGRKVKPRIVPRLKFFRERDDEGNWQTILKKGRNRIPIADINPPKYIIGFEEIYFCSNDIDDRTFQFMEKIEPLLKEDISIAFDYENSPSSINRMVELLASKTKKLEIYENYLNDMNEFNRKFPNFIYGVQSIYIYHCEEIYIDLVVKWLTTPREDGKPKIFGTDICVAVANINPFIERVKEEFIHSIEPVNFIICITYSINGIRYENFKIENKTTKEILELHWKEAVWNYKYFLVRHKNNGETTTKVTDLEEQMKLESMYKTRIWIEESIEE